MYIPAMNEIRRQMGEKAEYPDNPDERKYIVLFPEDYQGHMTDVEGNLALLVNEENAREIKRLTESVIEELEGDDD